MPSPGIFFRDSYAELLPDDRRSWGTTYGLERKEDGTVRLALISWLEALARTTQDDRKEVARFLRAHASDEDTSGPGRVEYDPEALERIADALDPEGGD